jgi:hypothetical protein
VEKSKWNKERHLNFDGSSRLPVRYEKSRRPYPVSG